MNIFSVIYELNCAQNNFYHHQVTGKYSVWLPDGRLMTVEYSVAKETGFVPKVTFQDNANPLQG